MRCQARNQFTLKLNSMLVNILDIEGLQVFAQHGAFPRNSLSQSLKCFVNLLLCDADGCTCVRWFCCAWTQQFSAAFCVLSRDSRIVHILFVSLAVFVLSDTMHWDADWYALSPNWSEAKIQIWKIQRNSTETYIVLTTQIASYLTGTVKVSTKCTV